VSSELRHGLLTEGDNDSKRRVGHINGLMLAQALAVDAVPDALHKPIYVEVID